MQPGTLVGSDVMAYESRVLVNGVSRTVRSWSISRQLPGVMPDELSSISGMPQASGSVEWGDKDVSSGKINPWNPSTGWIPKDGDKVVIEAGDGTSWWTQFVGVIDKSSGSVGGGIESSIVDNIDKLSARVNVPALMGWMPPRDDTPSFRRVSISNVFHTNTALRTAGFYSTPKAEFGCVLDLPLQGSTWPLLGECITSYKTTDPDLSPPGRVSFSDMTATYAPSVSRDGSIPVQLSMMRAPGHNGTAFVRASYGTKTVELMTTAASALARVNGVTVASIDATGSSVVQVLYKAGTITVKANNGKEASGAASLGATVPLGVIGVSADTLARIAGVQISHPTTASREFASVSFMPSANVEVGQMYGGATSLPAYTNTAAKEILSEIGSAVLRPYWIDETGVMQCVASSVLLGRRPVQTLTTLNDIRALDWETNLRSHRSEVRSHYLWASSNRRFNHSLTVWQSNESTTLGSKDTHEVIVEPPSGEDWFMVDETPTVLGRHPLDDVNKGWGTLMGGVYTDGASELWANLASVDKLDVSMERMGASQWKLTSTAKTLSSGYQVELRTVSGDFSGGTSLWPFWWEKNMSIIRAKGRTQWIERNRSPITAGGIGPVYEHNFGPWATGSDPSTETAVIDQITSFIAEHAMEPNAIITKLDVKYDPRQQLGDVVTIESPGLMGVILTCLIIGINNNANDSYTQSLSIMILDVKTTFTSYADFAKAWSPTSTYQTFATAWGALSTYSDFADDPLRGTS